MRLLKSFLSILALVLPLKGFGGPISPPESDILRQVEQQLGPTPSQHFLVSNEEYLHLFGPSLQAIRSLNPNSRIVHIGVGAEQNYTMIANLNPEYSFLVDRDNLVVYGHLLAQIAFMTSQTPKEFVAFFTEINFDESMKKIEDLYPQLQNTGVPVTKILEHFNYHLSEYSAQYAKLLKGRKNEANFLNNVELFNHVKIHFSENRVRVLQADLLRTNVIEQIGEACRSLNATVASLYLSNALDYVREYIDVTGNQFFKNVTGLPMATGGSALLTTHNNIREFVGPDSSAWHYLNLEAKTAKSISWDYLTTGLDNLTARKSLMKRLCRFFLRF